MVQYEFVISRTIWDLRILLTQHNFKVGRGEEGEEQENFEHLESLLRRKRPFHDENICGKKIHAFLLCATR
jgi:hypothetical protein